MALFNGSIAIADHLHVIILNLLESSCDNALPPLPYLEITVKFRTRTKRLYVIFDIYIGKNFNIFRAIPAK